MNIVPVIRDLLLRNQKAVVPGLGSFAIIQRPAQINKVTRVITPPKMIIRFEQGQKADDGSLLGYLVRTLKQNTDTAEKIIRDFSSGILEELQRKGRSVLEGLGTLSRQASGEISFEPDEDLVKRISLFELPKINIPTPPQPKQVSTVTIPETRQPRRKVRWLIPALILLFVMIIGFLAPVYLTGNLDELFSDIKSLITGEKKQPQNEKLVFGTVRDSSDTNEISRELDEQVDREKALSPEQKETAVDDDRIQPTTTTAAQSTSPVAESGKRYHIISGAFLVPNNAERYVEVLGQSGVKADILPKKGDYFMVSVGSFGSLAEATAAMKQLQGKIKNELWVMSP